MKYLLFLIVVVVATARNVLTDDAKQDTTTTTPNLETSTGKPIEACKNKNTWTYTHNVPHEWNPNLFYKCLGAYGFLQKCPTLKGFPLVFNRVSLVCDWEDYLPDSPTDNPGDSNSTSGSSSSTDSTRPPPSSPDCSKDPDRKKPHADCHKYYRCINGYPREENCPEGQNFDPIIAECGYVEC